MSCECTTEVTKYMWQIFVPTQSNDKTKFTVEHHRKWDARIRKHSGGLTLLKTAKGQWMNNGNLEIERVIPVQFAATEREFYEIADFTLEHYKQKEVLGVKLGEIIIKRKTK